MTQDRNPPPLISRVVPRPRKSGNLGDFSKIPRPPPFPVKKEKIHPWTVPIFSLVRNEYSSVKRNLINDRININRIYYRYKRTVFIKYPDSILLRRCFAVPPKINPLHDSGEI